MASLEQELRDCEEQISDLEAKKALKNEAVKADSLNSKELDRTKKEEQLQRALNDLYEMRTLLREMIAEDQESTEASTSSQEEPEEAKEVELDGDQLIGNRVMAPLTGVSQAIKHHSAIILDVEQDERTDKIMARLLFSFPLTHKMKPCQFFMKDSCRFDSNCKFNHGELVALEELEEYKEPDFRLVKQDALVLVPVENGLWDVGRVALMDENESAVKLLKTGKEVRAANSSMIPLGDEYEEKVDELSSSRPPNTSWSELKGERHGSITVGDLGQWTGGGFGMMMLQKMGYKLGQGLGKNSDGIVHAVQAKIYKKGKGLGEAEGQFVKPKKAAISAKANGEQENEIFSFINRKLAGKPADVEKTEAEQRKKMKESSETALGTQNLSVEMEIKKMRSNEKKLMEGIQRNLKTDPKTAAKLQQRLEALKKDIGRLERQHSSIRTEQNWRREKKKEVF